MFFTVPLYNFLSEAHILLLRPMPIHGWKLKNKKIPNFPNLFPSIRAWKLMKLTTSFGCKRFQTTIRRIFLIFCFDCSISPTTASKIRLQFTSKSESMMTQDYESPISEFKESKARYCTHIQSSISHYSSIPRLLGHRIRFRCFNVHLKLVGWSPTPRL